MTTFKVKNKFTQEVYKVISINNYYDGYQNKPVTQFVCVSKNNEICIIDSSNLLYVPNQTNNKEKIKE